MLTLVVSAAAAAAAAVVVCGEAERGGWSSVPLPRSRSSRTLWCEMCALTCCRGGGDAGSGGGELGGGGYKRTRGMSEDTFTPA